VRSFGAFIFELHTASMCILRAIEICYDIAIQPARNGVHPNDVLAERRALPSDSRRGARPLIKPGRTSSVDRMVKALP
jgi:hypothetical protein